MKKHTLNIEHLKVETFATFTDVVDAGGTNGCVCDMAPCICSKAEDCTGG